MSAAATTDPWIVKLYLGDHPNRRVWSADAQQLGGMIAGQAVTWTLEQRPGRVSQETVVKLTLGGDPVLAHVFSDHATADAAAEVRALVGRIEIA